MCNIGLGTSSTLFADFFFFTNEVFSRKFEKRNIHKPIYKNNYIIVCNVFHVILFE